MSSTNPDSQNQPTPELCSQNHNDMLRSAPSAQMLVPFVSAQTDLSRRELIQRAALGAAVFALLSTPEMQQAALSQSLPPPGVQAISDGVNAQFPYYADGPWDQPQYYETIQAGRRMFPKTVQSADIDGDGRDELIARGPGGIHVSYYDPDTGQWAMMPDGPLLSDADGWNKPEYYQTIQLADIDGDGRAELIARGPGGIQVWAYTPDPNTPHTGKWNQLPQVLDYFSDNGNWNKPQYYQTIQCADIDGDRQAELIARSGAGIVVWKYNRDNQTWQSLSSGPGWSDAGAWNYPQFYTTIQCADIDGDGTFELLGRDGGGVQAFKYDTKATSPTYKSWVSIAYIGEMNSSRGWNQPQAYETIQFADINGDGQAELIARAPDDNPTGTGIRVYQYVASNPLQGSWKEIAPGPAWSDANGWVYLEYSQTIQCADIDGDGCAELFTRNHDFIEVWKYDLGSATWQKLAKGPGWSNGAGWNQVQYYATITSARVLKPGDLGYTGNGGHTQSVLIGRGALSVQTFRYITNLERWTQTSAPPPDFTTDTRLAAAYKTLDMALRGRDANGSIRSTYNNQTYKDNNAFDKWQQALYDKDPFPISYEQMPRPQSSLGIPQGASGFTQADWNAVAWQIYWELQWIKNVYAWYGKDEVGGLLDSETISQFLTIARIAGYYGIDSTSGGGPSDTAIIIAVFALVATIAASILTGGAALAATGSVLAVGLGVAAGVAGGVSGAFSLGGLFAPGNSGSSIHTTINQLQSQLDDTFNKARNGQDTNLFIITGGTEPTTGSEVPSDYGRLRQIGEWIDDGTWAWNSGPNGDGTGQQLFADAVRGYAIHVWKTIANAFPWHYKFNDDGSLPDSYPRQYSSFDSVHTLWLADDNDNPIATNTLQNLFDPVKPGQPFPLAVPKENVFYGRDGWPTPNYERSVRPPLPSLGPDVRLAVTLSRDAATQEILATITIHNVSFTPITNVQITDARLVLRSPVAIHTTRLGRLTFTNQATTLITFPALVGQTAALRITGSYLGGTFGGSFRVALP